jgi:hypothetical protein
MKLILIDPLAEFETDFDNPAIIPAVKDEIQTFRDDLIFEVTERRLDFFEGLCTCRGVVRMKTW